MSETEKAPYETPDAIISMGINTYGRPLGMGGPSKWARFMRRLLKRRKFSQRFLLRIVYRNYKERFEVVHFDPEKCSIKEFVERLLASPTVRIVECGELLFKGRKSFGADFDPDAMMARMSELIDPTPTQPKETT